MVYNCVKFKVLVLLFITSVVISQESHSKVLVLIPGYTSTMSDNSIQIKNSWSPAIIKIFQKSGFKVFVANNLNPIGTIEENGEKLIQFLLSVQEKIMPKETLQILAHSIGGLYTLYANDKAKLRIGTMVTISTPFEGLEFLDQLYFDLSTIFDIERLLKMRSLNQLRPISVQNFITNIKNRPQFPIISFRGYQPRGENFFSAKNLSPEYFLTESLMSASSDGIVSVRSALSRGGFDGESYAGDYIHLDHWKQVTDAKFFTRLGMIDTNYIHKEQTRFYGSLIKHFKSRN